MSSKNRNASNQNVSAGNESADKSKVSEDQADKSKVSEDQADKSKVSEDNPAAGKEEKKDKSNKAVGNSSESKEGGISNIDNSLLNAAEKFENSSKLEMFVAALSAKAVELGLGEDDIKEASFEGRVVSTPRTFNARSYASAAEKLREEDAKLVGHLISALRNRGIEVSIEDESESGGDA